MSENDGPDSPASPGDSPATKPSRPDYYGDGKTDVAVFRPSNGQWFRVLSTGTFDQTTWGQSGDKPVAADYDGDGKADLAVFRPSNATWYFVGTTTGMGSRRSVQAKTGRRRQRLFIRNIRTRSPQEGKEAQKLNPFLPIESGRISYFKNRQQRELKADKESNAFIGCIR